MSESVTRRLGRFRDRDYFLVVDVEMDWDNVDSFVATVFYRHFDEETGEERAVEVARIDDRAHGHTHFDRLFEDGQPMEQFEGTVWDAWYHLRERWKTYARRYERNHERPT